MAIRRLTHDSTPVLQALGLHNPGGPVLAESTKLEISPGDRNFAPSAELTVHLEYSLLRVLAEDAHVLEEITAVAQAAINKYAAHVLAERHRRRAAIIRADHITAEPPPVRMIHPVTGEETLYEARLGDDWREADRRRRVVEFGDTWSAADRERLAQAARETAERLRVFIAGPVATAAERAQAAAEHTAAQQARLALPAPAKSGNVAGFDLPGYVRLGLADPRNAPDGPEVRALMERINEKVQAAYHSGRRVNVVEVGAQEAQLLGCRGVALAVGEERTVVELELRTIGAETALSVFYEPER